MFYLEFCTADLKIEFLFTDDKVVRDVPNLPLFKTEEEKIEFETAISSLKLDFVDHMIMVSAF